MNDKDSKTDVRQAWTVAGVVLAVSLFFGLVILPQVRGSSDRLVGVEAPDFSLPVLSGGEPDNRLRLANLRGKPVVIDFWASWCPPCRAQAPVLDAFSRKHGEAVVVLGINTSDEPAKAIAFLKSRGVSYTSVSDDDGAVGRAYGAETLPTLVMINKVGQITAVRRGLVSAEELDELFKAASAS